MASFGYAVAVALVWFSYFLFIYSLNLLAPTTIIIIHILLHTISRARPASEWENERAYICILIHPFAVCIITYYYLRKYTYIENGIMSSSNLCSHVYAMCVYAMCVCVCVLPVCILDETQREEMTEKILSSTLSHLLHSICTISIHLVCSMWSSFLYRAGEHTSKLLRRK